MKILEVTVTVPNLEETLAWFRDAGFPIEDDVVTCGESALRLIPGDVPQDRYVHLAFTIPANQIAAAATWATDHATILPDGDDTIVTGSDVFDSDSVYFEVPGQLNLEFIARHRLENPSNAAFGPNAIKSISEIGFASDDPLASNAIASRTFGLASFGDPMETFAPVGNDLGLLIFAGAYRPWAPTTTHQRRSAENVTITAPLAGTATIDGTVVTSVSDPANA